MELLLQQSLPHQQKAVDAVCMALEGVRISPPVQYYENPQLDLADQRIISNLKALQSHIPFEHRGAKVSDSCLNLDIKMETGTGKTYVYTKTIFELHKRYGINKFIIAVPSIAIKSGTAQFISEEYARRHFSDSCGYGTEIEIGVLETAKKKTKGRNYFPSVVSDFVKGSFRNQKKIYVLLVNMQLLSNSKKNTGMLWRSDYDYGAEGFYRPLDAIRATRPFVIIDEPHRFSRNQKAYNAITDEIKPQCIIRYGATFPDVIIGSGKNKRSVKDYQNLLYDLNACEAFNQGLIKGVAKEHFEPLSKQEEKIKILSIESKDSVTFRLIKKGTESKSFVLKKGDSLAILSEAFQGITITAISKNSVEFSNGIEKMSGEEMHADVYMSSYQEQMIRLALKRHFETERENFCNRSFRIKTLALFFIDDISSYRSDKDSGKATYLRDSFDILLKESLEHTLSTLPEQEKEYREYLQASLDDIPACRAAYFSQDNSDSDEKIAKEVNDILQGKKELLSFRNSDNTYNTRRFIFSKWTLREGWDNPNVFTIAKLRSSGSENSLLQEVGRGLRLPVDENGNRIANEEFLLNYIVDFTEADFAQKLVNQINSEIPQSAALSEDEIKNAAQKLRMEAGALFGLLLSKNYIDWQRNVIEENREAFYSEFPVFESGISASKVKDRNKDNPKPVKIRKEVFDEMREFWEQINRRYLLFYDPALDSELEDVVLSVFEKAQIFSDEVVSSRRDIVQGDGNRLSTVAASTVQYTVTRPIPYGTFLSRIMRTTNIPVRTLHKAMIRYCKKHGNINQNHINESAVNAFCAEFRNWKTTNLKTRFCYVKSPSPCGATALTHADGTPKEEIKQGAVGIKAASGTPCEKYLYDTLAYDSPLEKDNITTEIDDVIAYGKIPRNSIAIPTITGSMYSPDFMYVVKKPSGEKEINIVIETKDVEGKDSLREVEKAKIECARKFFDTISEEGYKVHFRDQLNNKQIAQVIDDILKQN